MHYVKTIHIRFSDTDGLDTAPPSHVSETLPSLSKVVVVESDQMIESYWDAAGGLGSEAMGINTSKKELRGWLTEDDWGKVDVIFV